MLFIGWLIWVLLSSTCGQVAEAGSSDFNYCSVKCDNGKYPTSCIFEGLSAYCNDFVQLNSSTEKKEILEYHNQLRNAFAGGTASPYHPEAANMMLMVWDEELEDSALRWGQQCTAALKRDDCRDDRRFKVGQNVAIVQGNETVKSLQVRELLDRWTDQWTSMEVSLLEKYNSHGPEAAELTQVIWGTSEKVGCADVAYRNGMTFVRQLICNYGPRGNELEKPVYLQGRPCSSCPVGTACLATKWPNLCAGDKLEPALAVHEDFIE